MEATSRADRPHSLVSTSRLAIIDWQNRVHPDKTEGAVGSSLYLRVSRQDDVIQPQSHHLMACIDGTKPWRIVAGTLVATYFLNNLFLLLSLNGTLIRRNQPLKSISTRTPVKNVY